MQAATLFSELPHHKRTLPDLLHLLRTVTPPPPPTPLPSSSSSSSSSSDGGAGFLSEAEWRATNFAALVDQCFKAGLPNLAAQLYDSFFIPEEEEEEIPEKEEKGGGKEQGLQREKAAAEASGGGGGGTAALLTDWATVAEVMVRGCGRADQRERLIALEEEILRSPRPSLPLPPRSMFTTLIVAWSRLGDEERLHRAWAEMLRRGFMASITDQASLIQVLGNAGKLEEMEQRFAEIKRQGLWPNNIIFNIMMKAYGFAGQLERMEETAELMKKERLVMDRVSHTTLMAAWTRAGRTEKAKGLFSQLRLSAAHSNTRLPVELWNAYLAALGKDGELDTMHKAFCEMEEQGGTHPDRITFTTMAENYGIHGELERMEETVELMKKRGISANVITYNKVMAGWARAKRPDKVKQLFNEMRINGITPNAETWSTYKSVVGEDVDNLEATPPGHLPPTGDAERA